MMKLLQIFYFEYLMTIAYKQMLAEWKILIMLVLLIMMS